VSETDRKVGHPEGVTVFVEHKTRTTYRDGTVVDSEPCWSTGNTLDELREHRARWHRPEPSSSVRTRMQREGIVAEADLYRQVRTEVGTWTDLDARTPVFTSRLSAAEPISKGQPVYQRPIGAGEQITVQLGTAPVWAFTYAAAGEGRAPIGVAAADYQPGDAVELADHGTVRAVPFGDPATATADAQPRAATIADLLTWDDLDALRRAGEIAVANTERGVHPEDLLVADDELVSALRQALGRLELGRMHGYEAKP